MSNDLDLERRGTVYIDKNQFDLEVFSPIPSNVGLHIHSLISLRAFLKVISCSCCIE